MMTDRDPDPYADRRLHQRYDAELSVDYTNGENFLFAYVTNISEMGIFIRSDEPLPVGTTITLRFGHNGIQRLELEGEVVWINPVRPDGDNINPGMGIRFSELSPEHREHIVNLIQTVAYLQDTAGN